MFQPMGTPRTLGITPSDPAYLDDPVYMFVLQVELQDQQPFQAQVGHRVPRHIDRAGCSRGTGRDQRSSTTTTALAPRPKVSGA